MEFINGGGGEAGPSGKRKSPSRDNKEAKGAGQSLSSASGKSYETLLVGVGFSGDAVSAAAEPQAKGSALRSQIASIEKDHQKRLSGVVAEISKAREDADALRKQAASLAQQLKACEEKLASSLVKKRRRGVSE